MKRVLYILILFSLCAKAKCIETDTLVLDLQTAIRIALSQSPSAQSARNSFLVAYWNYRNYRANYLPSVTLSSSPYYNNGIKYDYEEGLFRRLDQLSTDLSMTINQNIAFTGGNLFLTSNLTRIDEFMKKETSYSSMPVSLGYNQSLFGINSLKWDRRVQPLQYTMAKKKYAETIELVSAEACRQFFAQASAQTELEMAQQNFASADTLFQMAKGRYEVGTITENEMLQLEINRLNEETNVMDAEVNLQEVMQEVRSFLGMEKDTEIRIVMPESVPIFEVPLARAQELALENSPDPDSYKLNKMNMERNLAQAKAEAGLKADLYMELGLSQSGNDLSSSLRNQKDNEYVRVSISLPILDWGRGKGKVKVAKSELALTNIQTEQGMNSFQKNVQKLVHQFNMQARKVRIASLTDKRAEQRHNVARKLYIMGRNTLLDLNAAISEKNSARRNSIFTMQTYWTLYYTLRSMTAYDFEKNLPLTEELPID